MRNLVLIAIFLLLAWPGWALEKSGLKQFSSSSHSQQQGQDVRSAIRKAGIKLQREISLSIISVKRLDGQAQKLRQAIPLADSFLFQVSFLLTKSTKNQSALLDQLKMAQAAVKLGLQNISQAPAPCTGAQLPQLVAVKNGVGQFREALPIVLDASRFAGQIKTDADRAAVSIFSQLTNARDQKGLDSLDRFMIQLEQDLPSVHDRLLQSGPNGQLSDLLEQLECSLNNKCCNGEKGGVNNHKIKQNKSQGQDKSVDPLAKIARDMTRVGQDFAAAVDPTGKAGQNLSNVSQGITTVVDQMGKDVGNPVLKLHKQIDRSLQQIEGSLTKAQAQPTIGLKSCWFFFCKEEDGRLEYKSEDGMLFAGRQESLLSTKEIDQGDDIGDCYFIASIGAIAQTNPQIIKNMIKKEKDATYSVTFYRPKQFWEFWNSDLVPEIVRIDDKLPVNYGAEPYQSNLYPVLLEKAYAKWKGSYAAIGQGGSPDVAMQELTGVKGEHRSPAEFSIQELADLSKKGNAITVGTLSLDPEAPSQWQPKLTDPLYYNLEDREGGQTLVPQHAYWVESVDPVKGTVLLRNPWGWGEARILLTEAQFKNSLSGVFINPIQTSKASGS